jgi:DNA-binding response OmpR family regulator
MRMFTFCGALARGMQFCEPTAPSVGEEDSVGAPHRVLVIEDDAALREMLCEALAGEGYRVLPSDHAVAPLDVQQLRPSLVVLDLMLGGEPGGYGWLEAVRAWPWTARLPVLVCSGYLAPGAPAAHRVQALADATVPKPFALGELLAAVAGCMETAAAANGDRVMRRNERRGAESRP